MPKKIIESEEEKKARETIEEIASNIAALSRSVTALLSGRLREDTIVTLLVHSTKIPKWHIEKVLAALANMERVHLKK